VCLSAFTAPLVLHGIYLQDAGSYYQTSLYSVPLMGIVAALSGFFIGRGETRLILLSTIIVNLVNIALDFLLIFGYSPFIPRLGPLGAAISAIIGLGLQATWLFIIFLKKKNRDRYKTHRTRLNTRYINKCLRMGLPIAMNHSSEMLGWLVIIKLVSNTSTMNFTIVSVGSTLYLLFSFIIDGISRSLITMASYYVQLGEKKTIQKVLNSALLILCGLLLLLAIPFLFFSHWIISLLNLKSALDGWHHVLQHSLIFIWIYFVFFGLYWVFSSISIAKGQVKRTTAINVVCMWLLAIAPLFFLTKYAHLNPVNIWQLIDVYMASAFILTLVFNRQTAKCS
jgi:MATE family multidrug resistance protein